MSERTPERGDTETAPIDRDGPESEPTRERSPRPMYERSETYESPIVSYPDENTPSNGCNVSGTVGESVNDTPDCGGLFCGDRRGSA